MGIIVAGFDLGCHIFCPFVHLQGLIGLAEARADALGDDEQSQEQDTAGQEHPVHDEDVRTGHDEVHVQQQEERQHADVFPIVMRRQMTVFHEDFIEITAQHGHKGHVADDIEQPLGRIDGCRQGRPGAFAMEDGQQDQGHQGVDEDRTGCADGKDVEMEEYIRPDRHDGPKKMGNPGDDKDFFI